MSEIKEAIDSYIQRVRDLAEHCRGNEQATKQSLIGPLFTMLGYDLTDPRECRPEFRADFGKERSVKPVDWAFMKEPQSAPKYVKSPVRPLCSGLPASHWT